ncbi:MAG: dihydroorotate dehydrogenase [Desulfurococcaceae archaeon]
MFKPALKTSTEKLSGKYYYATFKLLEPLPRKPQPFQFVNIWIPGVDEVPMSISQFNEDDNTLSILFKVVGEGTRSIRDLQGFFGVKGPLGRGLECELTGEVLFVAGGSGIAPLPFFSKVASSRGVQVDVLWGVRSFDDLFELSTIAKINGDVYIATEDCTVGYCGKVSQVLRRLLDKKKYDAVIAVGPTQMLRDVCSLRSNRADFWVSLEAMVKCGYGACGSCTLKPTSKLLCTDGPLFRCDDAYEHLRQA